MPCDIWNGPAIAWLELFFPEDFRTVACIIQESSKLAFIHCIDIDFVEWINVDFHSSEVTRLIALEGHSANLHCGVAYDTIE